MTIYGTRPEAIKLAPVLQMLEDDRRFESIPVTTGQHREMLDQVHELFGLSPVEDLRLMESGQSLNAIVARVIKGLDSVLRVHRPDAVLVQGDTSTVMGAALAAFNRRVPVVHLEAGLRSGDLSSPFPEEANRQVTARVARLHLAPTSGARDNLLAEGVASDRIVVTGNTVIDALLEAAEISVPFGDPRVARLADSGAPILVVTTHRRENLGDNMVRIGRVVSELAARYPDWRIVLPVHRNPKVREVLLPLVEGRDNVVVTEPLDYAQFARLLGLCRFVLTDSGGVQEEAPSLGRPVLVLRQNTERPEAVDAGAVRLVGTEPGRVLAEAEQLIEDPEHYAAMAESVNPYGDGRAAHRVTAAIAELLGVGRRLPDFRV